MRIEKDIGTGQTAFPPRPWTRNFLVHLLGEVSYDVPIQETSCILDKDSVIKRCAVGMNGPRRGTNRFEVL